MTRGQALPGGPWEADSMFFLEFILYVILGFISMLTTGRAPFSGT